jgi:hypothetical protein
MHYSVDTDLPHDFVHDGPHVLLVVVIVGTVVRL